MKSPLRAMLWELWRTSRKELLLRLFAVCALSGLIFSVGWLKEDQQAAREVLRAIIVMILMIASVFSMTWLHALESQQSGFSFRLGFTRPVSTLALVSVPMVYLLACATACYLLPAVLLSLATGAWLPLAGPVIWVVSATACFVAAAWSPASPLGKRLGLAIAAAIVSAAIGLLHYQRGGSDPVLMELARPGYFAIGWLDVAGCALLVVLATGLTLLGVRRQRHGEGWRLPLGSPWTARSRIARSSPPCPFRNVVTAQLWYEFRRFGPTLPWLTFVLPLAVLILLTVCQLVNPRLTVVPAFWLCTLMLCPMVYQLVGADGAMGLRHKQGALQYSAFDAIRPLRNDQLIAIKLLLIAALSIAGWMLMALAAWLHTAFWNTGKAWSELGMSLALPLGDISWPWWAAGFCSMVLLYLSSTAIILAGGLWLPLHTRLFSLLMAVAYASLLLIVWDAQRGWAWWNIWQACGYALSVAIVLGCLLALRRAVTGGSLSRSYLAATVCLWGVYVAFAVALAIKTAPAISVPTVVTVLAGSMLLMPLASSALAPLALASHRHA